MWQKGAWVSFLIYLIGGAVFGLFYSKLKTLLGGSWLFLVASLFYIAALRLVADMVGRRISSKSDDLQ